MANGLGRVQAFRAGTDAVHDATAAEQRERIIELGQPLHGRRVTRVSNEAPGLQQSRRAEELFRIPPEGRARSGAASAQDALI